MRGGKWSAPAAAGKNGGMHTHDVISLAQAGIGAMNRVIDGKPQAVRLAWVVLLAQGHLLIEDVPGVGKTLLAKALGRVLGGSVRRIQFTPDLLPADVVGVNLFNQESRHFEFRPGPVFANVVIGDEINRASPKTQSAMLECMAEAQISIDGTTHRMPHPFMVVATQNPVDMEGTFALPEAQRDRFMARVSLGYPARSAEVEMLDHHGARDPLSELEPVCGPEHIAAAIETVRRVHASPELRGYIVRLVEATRESAEFSLGASPRASLHLLRAAKANAALDGREYASPDDVQQLAVSILAHRLIPREEGTVEHAAEALRRILAAVPVIA